ncbi:MAG: Sir2 family NAD-dependent protein deacetylase [Promethearchaeota archaeon]
MSLEEKIDLASKWIIESERLVVFTGAGCSTGSGIPDFRGPDGLWTRRDKGLPPPKPKVPWDLAEPNANHFSIVELLEMGKLDYLISQNIDGFHAKSGIPFEIMSELHGNRFFMKCLSCNKKMLFEEAGWDKDVWGRGMRKDPVREGQPKCPHCEGRLINSIVDFGDPLPYDELQEAIVRSQNSDVFFVVGSSLVVNPAASMPGIAKQNGARLIIINKGDTPYDMVADIKFDEKIEDVLPGIMERVRSAVEKN